jgi:signal transduction histidine kinase
MLIVGLLGLAYLLSLVLTRPLVRLSNAAQRISSGLYSNLNLPIDRKDEIGELGRAFYQMVTDIEKRELYLKDAGAKLAHSARLATIGQMGASIAHEVKNPLMAMHGHARLLKQKIQDPSLEEAIDILIRESDRCNQILQQMLRYSRTEDLQMKPYALMDVIRSSLQLVAAESKTQKVEIQLKNEIDAIPIGNAQRVQQVLLNLLINAIQASPPQSRVEVSAENRGHEIMIAVRDFGSGIPADVQDKIFDPFFTTKNKKEGSGLGLSIAATLIAEEGGLISFDTSESGTQFSIILPLQHAKSA